MKKLIVLVCVICLTSISAQSDPDTTYRIEVVSSTSPMFNFFRNPRYFGDQDKFYVGFGMSVRCVWHPGRLLSIGLMTGYYFISKSEMESSNSYSSTARLTAIPLQMIISMQKNDFEFGVGVGPYLMLSYLRDGMSEANGQKYEMGITFFGSYYFYLGDRIKFGPELRILNLGFRGITSLMPSINFRLDTYRY